MDDADRALIIEEQAMDRYARRRNSTDWRCSQHAATIYAHCIDCGGEIEAARRKAYLHAMRCIECQTIFEKNR